MNTGWLQDVAKPFSVIESLYAHKYKELQTSCKRNDMSYIWRIDIKLNRKLKSWYEIILKQLVHVSSIVIFCGFRIRNI